jgi:membrane fusion protein (multidrug efflux system)
MAEGAPIHRVTEDAEPSGNVLGPARFDSIRELRKSAPEGPSQPKAPGVDNTNEQNAVSDATTQPKSRLWRPLLFALLPLAMIAGAYLYVTGGQIMSTDNAYVQADTVGLSTDVSGIIASIEIHDNEAVKKGQVLFRLKQDSFQIALDGAKAQLGTVHDQILTLQESYKLSLAQVAQAEADLPYYQTTFKRQQDLLLTGAGTKAAFDQAQHDVEATKQRIAVAKAQADTALAQLSGDADQPIERNPFYLQAKSGVDNAQRDLNDTLVRAPFDGVVTNVNSVQVGFYLQASQQAFSLVSTTRLWVEASPKETELTHVQPGQAAILSVDTYPGLEWKGVVDSISPASGSSFSLLPAQNTTGNWVKVVQRIPMRVRIEDMDGKPPLRVGMSVTVDVDTGHARGLPDFITRLFHYGEESRG